MSLKQNIYGSLFVSNNITGNTLNLSTINENNSLTQLLVRDNINGTINYRDVSSIISAATSADTFVTGFTYDDSNNLTISRNDGIDFSVNIDTMSALTVTSLSGVNTIQDDGGELTIISDDLKIKGDSIIIQDNGGNDKISIDTTISTPELAGEISFNDNQTFSSNVFVSNVLTATTISATTYFGDGSNLTGISTDNFYVSGGSYDVGTNNINFSGNNVVTTFDVDLSSLISSVSANTFVIAGTYVDSTNTISLLRNDGNFVNVTGVTNTYVTGGTVSVLATDSNNNGTIGLFYKDSDGTPRTLPFKDTFITGGTYDNGSTTIEFTKNNSTTFDVDLSSLINSVSGDTFVVSGNADVATSLLTFTNNSGGTFNVTNSASLFSDNDINVTGGTYNPSNGCVTFTTNSGTTFDVCGFVTGITDTFTTGSTLVGETIQFDSNILGTNYYNVSLTPVLSGKTNNSTFNSYTSNTETILYSKVSGATKLSTTGLFAQKNVNNLEFKGLTSTGGTVTITNDSTTVNLEVLGTTDTNSFSTGGTVTQSATSGDSEVIVQIVGNSGFTPYNITGLTDTFVNDFSISSNTFTISQNDGSSFVATADTIDLATVLSAVTFDIGTSGSISATTFNGGTFNGTFVGDGSGLTGITDNNTFVTGFTYNDANTFTISRNDGVDLSTSINTMTGLTVNGSISATTYFGDGSNLTGISSDDNFVTGGTFSSETLTLNRQNGSVTITGFTSTPSLNDGEVFVGNTGNTAQSVAMTGDVNIDNTGLTTIQPDVVTYDKMQDVTQRAILGSETTSGGTVTEIPVVDQFLSTGVVTALLSDTSNWDINGNYTGSTISGTFQSQMYYDGNYFFIAVLDNVWIRLIRG